MQYLFEDYALDSNRRELRRAASLLDVEPRVFDVITHLIRHRDRVVSRDDLLAAAWNGRQISESALTTCINAARSALGDSGSAQRLIRTFPRKGFRFVGDVREEYAVPPGLDPQAGRSAITAVVTQASGEPSLCDKPSIAVLPFANPGGRPSEDYLGDGMTEDIITQLSRFSDLFVIAHNSSFQFKSKSIDVRQIGRELGVGYLLEGSVRRAGKRIRITAQLLNAVTGVHLWAESYDRQLTDVFAVQDEVARSIVAILAVHVRRAEAMLSLARPPATWQAYEYYLRAAETFTSFKSTFELADLNATRALLAHAISIDERYAHAHALLSDTHLLAWQVPLDRDYMNPAALDRAYQSAYAALRFDPNSSFAHAQVGAVLGYKRRFDDCIAEFEKAAMLNPNYADYRFARALVTAGEFSRAIHAAQLYKRSDPFYPPPAALWIGAAHYLLKRYSEALPHLREVVSRSPNFLAGHIWSAAIYAQLEMFQEARREIGEVTRIHPAFTLREARRMASVCRYQKDSEHYVEGLRMAGAPE